MKEFNKSVVQKVLRRCWASDEYSGRKHFNPAKGQDSIISLLIHDIFGGDILKTQKKKCWHFYNRINGERIDFISKIPRAEKCEKNCFEDIPSTPEEAKTYFAKEDYLDFLMKFVKAFEEVIGLKKYIPA